MASFRGRRPPGLLLVASALGALLWSQAAARAGQNDLNLLNLCYTGSTNTCLQQNPSTGATSAAPSTTVQSPATGA